jgi:hypothetical protein
MLTESVGLKLVLLAGEKVGVAADGPELGPVNTIAGPR